MSRRWALYTHRECSAQTMMMFCLLIFSNTQLEAEKSGHLETTNTHRCVHDDDESSCHSTISCVYPMDLSTNMMLTIRLGTH